MVPNSTSFFGKDYAIPKQSHQIHHSTLKNSRCTEAEVGKCLIENKCVDKFHPTS